MKHPTNTALAPVGLGFTPIELILVIVLLGILSAVALPRFVDLGKDACIAAITGLGVPGKMDMVT